MVRRLILSARSPIYFLSPIYSLSSTRYVPSTKTPQDMAIHTADLHVARRCIVREKSPILSQTGPIVYQNKPNKTKNPDCLFSRGTEFEFSFQRVLFIICQTRLFFSPNRDPEGYRPLGRRFACGERFDCQWRETHLLFYEPSFLSNEFPQDIHCARRLRIFTCHTFRNALFYIHICTICPKK